MKMMYPTQTKTKLTFLVTLALLIASLTNANAQESSVSSSSNNSTPTLLLSFSATKDDNGGQLNWVMENQTSVKSFVIERSGNGSQFDSIGVVNGTNNTHTSAYAFTDIRLLSGSNYYRLRQVDMDGSLKYSKVVTLSNASVTKVRVYPNPASAVVNYTLDMPEAGQAMVQVYNLAGMVVLTQQQTFNAGANQQTLAISTLKNGNYFIKISSSNGVNYAQSFVKML